MKYFLALWTQEPRCFLFLRLELIIPVMRWKIYQVYLKIYNLYQCN